MLTFNGTCFMSKHKLQLSKEAYVSACLDWYRGTVILRIEQITISYVPCTFLEFGWSEGAKQMGLLR
jgi:hypothetical protein